MYSMDNIMAIYIYLTIYCDIYIHRSLQVREQLEDKMEII